MRKLMTISVLCFILFTACTKINDAAIKTTFPNTVGDWWVYDKCDSNSNNVATHSSLYVTITGNRKAVTGEIVNVWEYHYPTYTDTNFVLSNSDSVCIYYNSNYLASADAMRHPTLTLYQPFSKWLPQKTNSIAPWLTLHTDTLLHTPYLGAINAYNTWYYDRGKDSPMFYNFYYQDSVGLVQRNTQHWSPQTNITDYGSWFLKYYYVQ